MGHSASNDLYDGVFYEDWEEWTSVADWLYDHHPNLWGNVTTGKNNISRTSHKSIYDPCPPGWKVPGAEDFAGIERIGVSAPYYVTIRCNGTQTAKIPLGGTFYEGRYDRSGSLRKALYKRSVLSSLGRLDRRVP